MSNQVSKSFRKEFANSLTNLFSTSSPEDILNAMEGLMYDWLSTNHADDVEYRTDVFLTVTNLMHVVRALDRDPEELVAFIKKIKKDDL
ncbi:hypothetical protein [Weeksella sp. HMSC059D05]|uniref:hypothetical protein n=1 Tax=Weeksella sp. HMSC059D05 TaxID=1715139 RepID=UPI0008A62E15|nr:hypothetical protein [Weeksella sp. HMSC059D05]OFM84590.1 hypothetical protein HMPREF2660_08750 [Weeksella sp. HMSC059D05]